MEKKEKEAAGQVVSLRRTAADVRGDLERAERERESFGRHAEEERGAFLKRCHDFRKACRRMRLSEDINCKRSSGSSSEGKPLERIYASSLDEGDHFGSESNESGISGNCGGACPRRGTLGRPKKKNHGSSPPKLDTEMCEAELKAENAKEVQEKAKKALKVAHAEKKLSINKCDDRARKLEMQRSQLERVRADITRIEGEITTLNHEAAEIKEIANNYARGMPVFKPTQL